MNTLPTIADIIGPNQWTAEQKKTFIESTLSETGRPGIDKVLNMMRVTDFYVAPSSTVYHSDYRGGLVDHILIVFITAMKLWEMYEANASITGKQSIPRDNIVIAAILHDICKINFYVPAEKWKKNDMDQWVTYQGYDVNDMFPIGHGEKSVVLLMSNGLELTVEEMLAIRWHMGAWEGAPMSSSERKSFMRSVENVPLVTIIQSADHMASMLFEIKQ